MWPKLIALWIITASFYANPQDQAIALIEKIPKSDQQDLERFFQFLIRKESMGYTLFGEKPISCAAYVALEHIHDFGLTAHLILEKGWQAWLRNRHLFADTPFYHLKRRSNGNISYIYAINKRKTLELIQKNLDVFHLLGLRDPETILNQICSDAVEDNPLHSTSLWGIFYGYGKKNSQLFELQTQLMQSLSSKMAPPFSPQKMSSQFFPEAQSLIAPLARKCKFGLPHPDLKQTEIQEFNELIRLRKGFELGENGFFLMQFASPGFVFWDEEETLELRNSYHKTRSQMRELYQTGSFLEKTLQQWISPQ